MAFNGRSEQECDISNLGTLEAHVTISDVGQHGLISDQGQETVADYVTTATGAVLTTSNDSIQTPLSTGVQPSLDQSSVFPAGIQLGLDRSCMTDYLNTSQFMQPVECRRNVVSYDGSYLSYIASPIESGSYTSNNVQTTSSISDPTSYTSYVNTPTRLSFNTDSGSSSGLMTSPNTSASDNAPSGGRSTAFTHSTPVLNKNVLVDTRHPRYHLCENSTAHEKILDASPVLNSSHHLVQPNVSSSQCEPDACFQQQAQHGSLQIQSVESNDSKHMTSSATWQDLFSAVQEDCKEDSIPYGLIQKCENQTFQVPLSVRVSLLQLQFTKLSTKYKTKVEDLQFNYQLEAAKLESQRYQTLLRAALTPWQINGINNYFDQRHTAVIESLEQKLEQFADTTVQEAPSSGKGKFTSLNATAVKIMERYYNRNKEHPYPSYSTAESLATAGGITVEQVKKWFANRRMRNRNTKKLSDIAHRRKVTKSPGVDSLFVGITPRD